MKTGTIQQILPRAMYAVEVEGRSVRVGLAASSKHSMVRLLVGDRVELKLSPTDPNRGQIIRKL
jgi:translation initiation factor IF-1